MGMTIDRLKELCEGEGFKYFLAPDRPMVTMGFTGITGRYQFIIPIELDGRFIQLRTVSYLECPADHPHVNTVLAIIGELNFRMRMTKFGWDPTDGEINACADVWIEDGDLTQKQFGALFKSVLPVVDMNNKRLSEAIETGKDPGEIKASDMLGSNLPTKMRLLLEKLAAAGSGDSGDGDDKPDEPDEDDKDKPLTV